MSEAANENVSNVAILEGFVNLADEGESLPGVLMTLTEEGRPPREAVTNEAGEYRFDDVAEGPAKLTAQMEGFHTVDCPHIVLHGGINALDIQMAPAAVEA